MKKFVLASFAVFLFNALVAQEVIEEREIKKADKEKSKKDSERKTIVITLNGKEAGEKKYTVEVDGDKVTVNGKDVSELKDVNISINKNSDYRIITTRPGQLREVRIPRSPMVVSPRAGVNILRQDGLTGKKGALLGINMEKTDKGVKIIGITKESGAEKAGLKVDDIVTKIDDKKIENELDITKIIGSHKPGDEVEITYTRDGKSAKTKAVLGERSIQNNLAYSFESDMNDFEGQMKKLQELKGLNGFDQNMGQLEDQMKKLQELKGMYKTMPNQNFDFYFKPFDNQQHNLEFFGDGDHAQPFAWSMGGSKPALGITVKETEDSKGLEITGIGENSIAAKAGLMKGDIVTEVAGKAVNNVEDIRDAVNDNKEKPFNVKYTRNGKSNTVEIKFPKKLKETAL